MRLEGGDGVEERGHATPLGLFPGSVRLDPEQGRHRCTEPAQRGKETRLPNPLAQIDTQDNGMKALLFGGCLQARLPWEKHRPDHRDQEHGEKAA